MGKYQPRDPLGWSALVCSGSARAIGKIIICSWSLSRNRAQYSTASIGDFGFVYQQSVAVRLAWQRRHLICGVPGCLVFSSPRSINSTKSGLTSKLSVDVDKKKCGSNWDRTQDEKKILSLKLVQHLTNCSPQVLHSLKTLLSRYRLRPGTELGKNQNERRFVERNTTPESGKTSN